MLEPGIYQSVHDNGMFDSYKITLDVKETDKAYTFTLIECISQYCPAHIEQLFAKSKRVVIRKDKGGHAIRKWEDGTFTLYPFQAGIPFYFKKIKQ